MVSLELLIYCYMFFDAEEREVPQQRGRPSLEMSDRERRNTRHEKKTGSCVWDIHQNFHITIHTACNISVPEGCRDYVSEILR